jgi:hypothetical protein
VDGSGNLYVAGANNGNGLLLKETLSAGRYTQSTLPVSGTIGPQSLAVDGVGNVYFEDAVTRNIFEEKLTANGYVQTLLVGDLHTSVGPWGIALDGIGNLYIAYPGQNQIIRADFSDPPSLNFASTSIGSTSADSPQTVTLNNVGNADLTFPIPAGGNNPSITTNFTLDENAPSACPVTGSGSSQPGTLAAGGSCVLPVSFAPSAAGSLNGSLALTDNSLNAAAPGYATQSISLSGTSAAATPTITWPASAAITYGTALGSSQLNATANVPGTFSYSPAAGTVLGVGTQTLTVTFTPTDTADYTTASATVQLTVNKGMPTITWPAPAPINYGTALSGAQLNASANLPGTFAYSPAAGTVLTVGTQALTVTFVPTDTTDYSTATAAVQLTVSKATPVITWPTPAPINYGTPLGSTQLNATANVPGKFLYSPAAGTVLSAGTNTLQVNFTPTDGADYNNASASVPLVVNAPGFSVTASPSSVSVKQGVKASSTITISPTGGFNGSVTLSTSGLPKGVSASFSLNPTKTASTVTFSATGSANLGTASVTIIGKSGSLTQTATIALTVTHK